MSDDVWEILERILLIIEAAKAIKVWFGWIKEKLQKLLKAWKHKK